MQLPPRSIGSRGVLHQYILIAVEFLELGTWDSLGGWTGYPKDSFEGSADPFSYE